MQSSLTVKSCKLCEMSWTSSLASEDMTHLQNITAVSGTAKACAETWQARDVKYVKLPDVYSWQYCMTAKTLTKQVLKKWAN